MKKSVWHAAHFHEEGGGELKDVQPFEDSTEKRQVKKHQTHKRDDEENTQLSHFSSDCFLQDSKNSNPAIWTTGRFCFADSTCRYLIKSTTSPFTGMRGRVRCRFLRGATKKVAFEGTGLCQHNSNAGVGQ